jgi:hypothetical protein
MGVFILVLIHSWFLMHIPLLRVITDLLYSPQCPFPTIDNECPWSCNVRKP